MSHNFFEKKPYYIWSGKRPYISFMKIWSCEVYVKQQISVFVARTGVFLENDFIFKGIVGGN